MIAGIFCPAITVEVGLSKHPLRDVDALQIEADIIFIRNTDASMHLDRVLGRKLRDLAGPGLREQ